MRKNKTDWTMPKRLEHGKNLRNVSVSIPLKALVTLQHRRALTGQSLSTQIRNIVLEKLSDD